MQDIDLDSLLTDKTAGKYFWVYYNITFRVYPIQNKYQSLLLLSSVFIISIDHTKQFSKADLKLIVTK